MDYDRRVFKNDYFYKKYLREKDLRKFIYYEKKIKNILNEELYADCGYIDEKDYYKNYYKKFIKENSNQPPTPKNSFLT